MRRSIVTGIMTVFISVSVGLAAGWAADEVPADPTMPKAPFIMAQTVREWQAEGRAMDIIDVREPEEFAAGHLEGAVNIPYRDIEARKPELPVDRPLIFYCIHSSWRAPYVANALVDEGMTNTYVLEGGIAAWNSGGQAIVTSSAGPGEIAPYPTDLEKKLHHPADQKYPQPVDMTLEELAYYDGQEGRPAFVAVDGTIYDLTNSRLWRGGTHDPSHGEAVAGRDLTEVLKKSPHGDTHLRNFPKVGALLDG